MSKKKKRQKFIRKILKDNKVSKKEVQKAAKKGIRLDRISKAARKSTQPGNVFSRPATPVRFSSPKAQGPSGLYPRPTAAAPKGPVIKPGAQTLINRDIAARAAQGTPVASFPTPGPEVRGPDVPQDVQDEFDTSYYDDLIAGQDQMISDLNMKIGDLTNNFQAQLGEMTTAMQQERADAAAAMQEMQGSFAQAMAQRGNRARVQGIRFADRGTGGATQAQLARRGLRGTFGRGGERLMKISSLNV